MPTSAPASRRKTASPKNKVSAARGPAGEPSVKISSDELASLRSQLAALSLTQGVIELTLDGRILTANEHFLKITGYARDELKDQPHSRLVEPAIRDSAGYKQLWQDLSAGQPYAAETKYLRKDGSPVWIQATFQSVLNASNRPPKSLP